MNDRGLKTQTLLGAGALVFHPGRPLSMRQSLVEVVVDDGVTLRGTIATRERARSEIRASLMRFMTTSWLKVLGSS